MYKIARLNRKTLKESKPSFILNNQKLPFMRYLSLFFLCTLFTFESLAAASSLIYVTNLNSNTVSVIDTTEGTVIDTISVSSSPFFIAITPDNRQIYVGSRNHAAIDVINPSTNTVVETITLPGGASPNEIVVTPDSQHVYVASENDFVYVIETTSNTITESILFPQGSAPLGATITPDGEYVYIANSGNQTVGVIETVSNTLVSTIQLQSGGFPHGLTVTPDGAYVYVSDSMQNVVYIIDTSTRTLVTTIATNPGSGPLTITPSGDYVYLIERTLSTLSIIDTGTNTITSSVSLIPAASYQDIIFSSDGTISYMTSYGMDNVTVFDNSSQTILNTIPVGSGPFGMVLTSLLPPQSLSCEKKTNDFGIIQEYYNLLNWQAPFSSIAGYYLRRNGDIIATLPSTALSYEDHNQPIQAEDTYTLTAFNSAGSESNSVTVTSE